MTWVWMVVAALALLALVVLVVSLVVGRRSRTKRLKQRFGPEYERTVAATGAPAAERELAERERLHDALDIQVLTPSARQGFAQRWRGVQTAFVDDPAGALHDADRLVTEVMQARGYPVEDFHRRAADISVDHPTIVENYRAAHAVSHTLHGEQLSTETQRQAVVHYRALFDALLATEHPANAGHAPTRQIATAAETRS